MTCHGCLVAEARPFSNLCPACEADHLELLREERRQQMDALEAIREDNDEWIEGQTAKNFLCPYSGLTRVETSEEA
jgi:hypothetical protein